EHDHRHELHRHDGYHDEQGDSSADEKRLRAQAQLGEKLASAVAVCWRRPIGGIPFTFPPLAGDTEPSGPLPWARQTRR
ncbi:MAG TPA: hypothetical protein VIK32_08360, partial [Candidatus Limnocylindrales bacterium]